MAAIIITIWIIVSFVIVISIISIMSKEKKNVKLDEVKTINTTTSISSNDKYHVETEKIINELDTKKEENKIEMNNKKFINTYRVNIGESIGDMGCVEKTNKYINIENIQEILNITEYKINTNSNIKDKYALVRLKTRTHNGLLIAIGILTILAGIGLFLIPFACLKDETLISLNDIRN